MQFSMKMSHAINQGTIFGQQPRKVNNPHEQTVQALINIDRGKKHYNCQKIKGIDNKKKAQYFSIFLRPIQKKIKINGTPLVGIDQHSETK